MFYLRQHQQRRKDRSAQQWREGLGRGAVDASFVEDPCPFQQTGQFWTPASEVALLGLDTFWRTRRRSVLLRHSRPAKGAKMKCADWTLDYGKGIAFRCGPWQVKEGIARRSHGERGTD